ncbi:unnamed protein product [Schistosoma rodhaini]|nr:unnamed protein product [Schistosoma rodhaini]
MLILKCHTAIKFIRVIGPSVQQLIELSIVPQVLHYFGAIEYSEDLTKKIHNGEEIANGSELEVEIRAATILAVHNIVKSLNSKNISCNSIMVDNFLWNYRRSHADEIDAEIPMHRTRCIYY